MKNQPKLLAVLTSAALSAGCASGGGAPGGKISPFDLLACIGSLFVACPAGSTTSSSNSSSGTSSSTNSEPPQSIPFTSWANFMVGTNIQATGLEIKVNYETTPEGSILSVSPGLAVESVHPLSQYYSGVDSFYVSRPNLAALGQPGIEIGGNALFLSDANSPFGYATDHKLVGKLVANPQVLGWNYQSFGVWDSNITGREFRPMSYGAVTPASAVPTSGAATFTGKLAGFYVSPSGQGSIAAADLNVNASFSTRSLSFSTTGTRITRDLGTGAATPNLNLNGALTYSPGSNSFTGTLTNTASTMTGSSKGLFYGPAAQELGGVFSVKSPTTVETFSGAYGAKR